MNVLVGSAVAETVSRSAVLMPKNTNRYSLTTAVVVA